MDERTLEGWLKFTNSDLAANRAGALSAGQASRLRWFGIGLLVVGPAVLIGFVIGAWVASTQSFLTTLIFLFPVGAGLAMTWYGFAFLTDAVDGRVAYVTGTLRLRMVRGRYGPSYFADVGPVSKGISVEAYSSLPQGDSFHVYYAPACRSLLSVEPASAAEPKPAHLFGPDSAHVWDRIRASWIVVAVGAVGLIVGVHTMAIAHPAHTYKVGGTVADYSESHHKGGTTRRLYLMGDSDSYSPQSEDSYSPPLEPFSTLIGKEVVLYVNDGTRDVLALNDGEALHAADWYLNPDHETRWELGSGIVIGALSLAVGVFGVVGIVVSRRSPAAAPAPDAALARTPMYSGSALFTPPSVRPWHANWPAAFVFLAVGATLGLAFLLATHR
ncbi:MAG TPA: hypothetical protein VJQ08_02570 [Candidatus Dormibacteraeota bacterium]|nr:hypothetical protein [Candidatus Dormibacteraeota bacterium]